MKNLFFALLMLCSVFQSQAQYTDILPLNKGESRMLLTGILTYTITYPDSVQADLMLNLVDLQKFIDSKDTLSGFFKHIPVKAINYVELKYFGKEGIMGYSPEGDNRDMKSRELMLFYEIERIENSKKTIEIEREKIKNKVSFQCKYYTANGYPCPADAPKVEIVPVKTDEN
jgi:hypothetical protein